MCGMLIGAGIMAATTAFSAYSTYKSSKSQAAAVVANAKNQETLADYNADITEDVGEYNAEIAENNAAVQEESAIDAIERGTRASAAERISTERSNAFGTALRGSSGTTVGQGTNLDIIVQNKAFGEINALTAMNNAEREAYGHKVSAADARNQAEGLRYTSGVSAESQRFAGDIGVATAATTAGNIRYGGALSAAGTLVSGASNVYQRYPDLFSSKKEVPRVPEGNKQYIYG